MGRGRNYTEDDNRKLMVLIKDYPDKKASFIAKKAIALGICEGRSLKAVTTQVYRLKNPPVIEVKKPEQITMDDTWTCDKDLYITAKKYEDLIKTIFDNATLWTGAYEDGLFFNIPSLRAWLKEYEKDRFNAKIIELLDAPRNTYTYYERD